MSFDSLELERATREPPRPLRGLSTPEAGIAPGTHVTPGRDDGGWIVPPPAHLTDGTLVQLLKDGEALHFAFRTIDNARRSVRLEIYIFKSDGVGLAFADLLARRARDGLSVCVLYDSIGSATSDPAMFDMMRRAGVHLREFHPWQPWRTRNSWRPFNRDHRKLLVADDEAAVLGGQNLGEEYGSSWITRNSRAESWRDTAVGLRGPAVRLLAHAFGRIWNYSKSGGPIHRAVFFHTAQSFCADPVGSLLANEGDAAGTQRRPVGPGRSSLDVARNSVGVLASVPTPRSPLVPALRKLLRDARSSLDMTMAYFAPPEELADQLCRSAQSGVRVRLMLPGRSDVRLLLMAARGFYERLLATGVEVYERQNAVLHAKTLCIDRQLSIVGSTNLDSRSVQFNCELSAVLHSPVLGEHMHALFEHDIRFARRMLPDEWRCRPARDRLLQSAVMRARYLL